MEMDILAFTTRVQKEFFLKILIIFYVGMFDMLECIGLTSFFFLNNVLHYSVHLNKNTTNVLSVIFPG